MELPEHRDELPDQWSDIPAEVREEMMKICRQFWPANRLIVFASMQLGWKLAVEKVREQLFPRS